MFRTKTLAAAALGLAAAGCAAPHAEHLEALNNPSLYSVHQPVVQRTDFVFDVATDSSGVSAAEQARLDAWFQSIGLNYGDTVTLDEAAGYASPAARADIADVAGRYGLLLSEGAPVTTGEVQPGSVRVIASRATASVPDCPVFDSENVAPLQNTSANYGCATNSNLSAMVANPNDLVVGRGGSGQSNASTASRAIRTYRERTPTGQQPLASPSTTSQGGN